MLLVALAATAALQGYVFRETDGSPPRRPMTVELVQQARSAYRQTTRPDGTFTFSRVREGRYGIRARYNDFVVVEDGVTVTAAGPNFAAVMIPKRRAGTGAAFGTVRFDQLAARSDREWQKKVREASRLAVSGDPTAAARLYEEVLAIRPQPEVWDALALLYFQMRRKEDAFQALENAIAQDPKFLFPYAHLATIYLEERRHKDLLAVAGRALLVDPKWLTAHLYLAEAQAGLRETEAAGRAAQAASELVRGKAPGPHLLLARIAWDRKDCPQARLHLNRYLELNTSARALPEIQKSLHLLSTCSPY